MALPGCSLFATPRPAPTHDSSLAPAGPVGYVVCPDAVTPVELATRTAEAEIPLPVAGTPVLGNFAITTSADGRWAYVVTSSGILHPRATASGMPPATTGSATTATSGATAPGSDQGVRNVVIPIDLTSQRASPPIPIPGQGGTHAIALMANGRTILAASGSTIVPVDAVTRDVGTPLDLGAGHTVFGLALDPRSSLLYALVPGGVVPVDTATAAARAEIPTGLSVSSVYSPHGIVVSADGSTVYVVGQGGPDYGGRVLALATATAALLAASGFDRFGISDPAALALTTGGSGLLVVDSANNWIDPVALATFSDPGTPVRLPQRPANSAGSGTQHPTDIVIGSARTGAFVVDGFHAVLPYAPATQVFGRSIPVCSGASSMAVAPAP